MLQVKKMDSRGHKCPSSISISTVSKKILTKTTKEQFVATTAHIHTKQDVCHVFLRPKNYNLNYTRHRKITEWQLSSLIKTSKSRKSKRLHVNVKCSHTPLLIHLNSQAQTHWPLMSHGARPFLSLSSELYIGQVQLLCETELHVNRFSVVFSFTSFTF